MIYVEATKKGFLGEYRNVGDRFEVTEKQFSKSWMVKTSKAVKKEETEDVQDELTDLDKEALLTYAKANCPGLKVTSNMKDETIRNHIRSFGP